jgi:hypothetical protein
MKYLVLLSVFLALPLVAQNMTYTSAGQITPLCEKGQYLTIDGRCLHDQTGESHPAGDGCNFVTCLDQNCRWTSVTLMSCSRPDDPAPNSTSGAPDYTTLLPSTPGISSIRVSDPWADFRKRHARMIRRVISCQKRKWPIEDPVCVGTAAGLIPLYVEEHPELFSEVKGR